ncbi:MAG: S8/S53 family peptidase [Bacteroidetes bacterium]|nr:S8/S53 family peptidase [Bacteroidota bacterium]
MMFFRLIRFSIKKWGVVHNFLFFPVIFALMKGRKEVTINQEMDTETPDTESGFQEYIKAHFDGKNITGSIDYHQLLNLNSPVKNNLGLGMTIALLDTGIFHHPVLRDSILAGEFDFTGSPLKAADKNGHGTFLSGLICARSDNPGTMNGIAPKSRVANIKVIKDNGSAVGEYLESGLKKVSELFSTGIINMSLNITVQEYDQIVAKNTFDILAENYVLVAAAGENEQLLADAGIFSPATSGKVIAVGTVDETFFKANPSPVFDSRLDFIVPCFDLVSCSNDAGFTADSGVSSMASAIVSAIVALIFSGQGSDKLSFNNALKALNLLAMPYGEISDFNSLRLIKP